jgi:hypothetical protein
LHYKKVTRYLGPTIKKLIGCDSGDPLVVGGYPLIVRNFWISRHNLDHIEIARLDRIQMGSAQVSGIHGFYSSMYHDEPIEAEYDGILDEVRVFIHEAVTRPSLASVTKLLYWMIWMATKRMNPVTVVLRHAESVKRFQKKLHRSQERDSLLRTGLAVYLETSSQAVPIILANQIDGLTEAQVQALRYQLSSRPRSL